MRLKEEIEKELKNKKTELNDINGKRGEFVKNTGPLKNNQEFPSHTLEEMTAVDDKMDKIKEEIKQLEIELNQFNEYK